MITLSNHLNIALAYRCHITDDMELLLAWKWLTEHIGNPPKNRNEVMELKDGVVTSMTTYISHWNCYLDYKHEITAYDYVKAMTAYGHSQCSTMSHGIRYYEAKELANAFKLQSNQ